MGEVKGKRQDGRGERATQPSPQNPTHVVGAGPPCSPDNTTFFFKEQAHQSFCLNSLYIHDPLGQDMVWLCVGFSPTHFFTACFVTGQVYFSFVICRLKRHGV